MRTRAKIVVVEDEPSICDNILYALESEGMDVTAFNTGEGAVSALESHGQPDLIVLDVGLPDMSGFDLCRDLRKNHSTPVLFLTARSGEVDRVVGLEIGGDDYVVKPFSPRELAARVKAILRRTAPAAAEKLLSEKKHFVVDDERYLIFCHGRPMELSRYEFRLLSALLRKPGRVFTRAQLMDAAWEEPEASMERTVDTHIKSIRAKIRAIRSEFDPIKTHRGIGYSMELNDEPD